MYCGNCDSLKWTDTYRYCAVQDTSANAPGAKVEKRPAHHVERLMAAKAAARAAGEPSALPMNEGSADRSLVNLR
jgi:hypothetical protein